MRVETIFSHAGVEICSSPFLVATELEALAVAASEDFVRSLPKERLEGKPPPISLEILNGGKYYFLQKAYERATGKSCRVATLRAKRGHASAATYGGPAHLDKDLPANVELWRAEGSDWCVRIWDHQPLPAGPLLIGDTIGTGTTLAGVLGWVAKKMEEAGAVHDIFVFTIAGAAVFAKDGGVLKKLEPVDKVLQKYGCELHVTFANGRFALADNGTDMSMCASMGAELLPQASEALERKIGAGFIPHMKCAIWDWGDRFRKPKEHLIEVQQHFALQEGCPKYISDGIAEQLTKLQENETQSLKRPPEAALDEAEPVPKKALSN